MSIINANYSSFRDLPKTLQKSPTGRGSAATDVAQSALSPESPLGRTSPGLSGRVLQVYCDATARLGDPDNEAIIGSSPSETSPGKGVFAHVLAAEKALKGDPIDEALHKRRTVSPSQASSPLSMPAAPKRERRDRTDQLRRESGPGDPPNEAKAFYERRRVHYQGARALSDSRERRQQDHLRPITGDPVNEALTPPPSRAERIFRVRSPAGNCLSLSF